MISIWFQCQIKGNGIIYPVEPSYKYFEPVFYYSNSNMRIWVTPSKIQIHKSFLYVSSTKNNPYDHTHSLEPLGHLILSPIPYLPKPW